MEGKWSADEIFELIRLYKSGATHREISKSIGRKMTAIASKLFKLGFTGRNHGNSRERHGVVLDISKAKDMPCLRCGKLIFTDPLHRICGPCTKHNNTVYHPKVCKIYSDTARNTIEENERLRW